MIDSMKQPSNFWQMSSVIPIAEIQYNPAGKGPAADGSSHHPHTMEGVEASVLKTDNAIPMAIAVSSLKIFIIVRIGDCSAKLDVHLSIYKSCVTLRILIASLRNTAKIRIYNKVFIFQLIIYALKM